MTDSKFIASGLFAMSLFAVPGADQPNVAIDGLTLASGVELKAGPCNEVRVFVHAAPRWKGDARVQLVLREVGGDLTYSGTRTITLAAGGEQTLAFEGIPVRTSGRHLVVASVAAGDTTEAILAANVEGTCARG